MHPDQTSISPSDRKVLYDSSCTDNAATAGAKSSGVDSAWTCPRGGVRGSSHSIAAAAAARGADARAAWFIPAAKVDAINPPAFVRLPAPPPPLPAPTRSHAVHSDDGPLLPPLPPVVLAVDPTAAAAAAVAAAAAGGCGCAAAIGVDPAGDVGMGVGVASLKVTMGRGSSTAPSKRARRYRGMSWYHRLVLCVRSRGGGLCGG